MTKQLLEKLQKTRTKMVGKLPVVILPLENFERMKEDLEMFSSKTLARDIEKARKEVRHGKGITLAEVKRLLKL